MRQVLGTLMPAAAALGGASTVPRAQALGAYDICLEAGPPFAAGVLQMLSQQPVTASSLAELRAVRQGLQQVATALPNFGMALAGSQPLQPYTRLFSAKCFALQQFADEQSP